MSEIRGIDSWLSKFLAEPEFLRMGHCQRAADQNLGMGWLYYSLVRLIRPTTTVVIGSWRGFAPIVFAKAMSDNVEQGQVVFIDPSLVDDFWTVPTRVTAHFAKFGAANVEHFHMTTSEFTKCQRYEKLRSVGIVMIDGYHDFEHAKLDFEAFASKLAPNGMMLFHDSISTKTSHIYGEGREYSMSVKRWLDELKADASFQVLDLPFGNGLSLVKRA
jgi:predicted O-methyltransferase YrrM